MDSGGRGFVRVMGQWWTWFCQGNGTVVDVVLSGQWDSGGRGFVRAMGQWWT